MGIKQVTCCICNSVVNKAQTLSIGKEGRACRSHEGVEEKAKIAQQVLKPVPTPTKQKHHATSTSLLLDKYLPCKCFVCRCTGMNQLDFMTEMLLAHEVYMQEHKILPDFLNPTYKETLYPKLIDFKCLFMVQHPCDKVELRGDFLEIAKRFRQMFLCKKCVEKHNIDLFDHLDPDYYEFLQVFINE